MYLSGCWRQEKGKPLPTSVILTRDAAGHLVDIHPRVPVIIPREEIETWLLENASAMQQPVTGLDYERI